MGGYDWGENLFITALWYGNPGNPQKCPGSSCKNVQKWSTAGIFNPENSKLPNNGASLRCLESFSSVSKKKTYLNTDLRVQPHCILIWLIPWSLFVALLLLMSPVQKQCHPQMSQKATPPLRHRTCEHTPRRNHRPSDSDTTHDTHVWNYEPPLYLDWWNTIYICICLGWCWKPSWTIRIVTKKTEQHLSTTLWQDLLNLMIENLFQFWWCMCLADDEVLPKYDRLDVEPTKHLFKTNKISNSSQKNSICNFSVTQKNTIMLGPIRYNGS